MAIAPFEQVLSTPETAPLLRTLNLPLAILFGLGVTIGAGIYVLIGATVGRAGIHAPIAFVVAALVMAPTAASFSEFASRMPVSAGEAAYVGAGFNSVLLARLVGLMVIAVGVISAAAIAKGSAGYFREFVDLQPLIVISAVVLMMGTVAAVGILESVVMASVMTLIELGGLLIIIFHGVRGSPDLWARLPEIYSGLGQVSHLIGIISATLLAFFAFIGFEGLANVAEEIKEPRKNVPRAIFLTLVISTVFYFGIVWVALVTVPIDDLAASQAPLSLVFAHVTGASPLVISAIAIVATGNGVIALMVMASRVIYGMADRKMLPSTFSKVSPRTRTPVNATAIVVALVLILAITFPLEGLADTTSRLTLVIFGMVNAALVKVKRRSESPPVNTFIVPIFVPIVGCLLCAALLISGLF
jgi:basic amino acid/polyamine antiporter, APA family